MQCHINAADLSARLNGTVCMYADTPYLVLMEEPNWLQLHDFLTKKFVQKIKSNDPLFDVATPPLGYFHTQKNKVVFAERLPHRQFQQGITTRVLHFSYFDEQQRFYIHSEGFRDMMMKRYNPLGEVLSNIIKDVSNGEYALSNEIALVKSVAGVVKIYFQHEEVAFSSLSELKKRKPSIRVPESTRSWITEKYLSKFDWQITK